MPIKTTVLFSTPQQEIASLITDRLARCASASIVSGFITVNGLQSIAAPIRANPHKLNALVVGSATYQAFESLDGLIAAGVPPSHLFVHLGHTAPRSKHKPGLFYTFHPMLHSKVYYMDMGGGNAAAFIGSHNITGFALHGLNGEAAVLLEGPSNSAEFEAIRHHIEECCSQASAYVPAMKRAYQSWATRYLDGLQTQIRYAPGQDEERRTIVVLAGSSDSALPKKDDHVYFELPDTLGKIESLGTSLHLYVFSSLPKHPLVALKSLRYARAALLCSAAVIGGNQRMSELRADWRIPSAKDPRLLPAPRPFRPETGLGMQQVLAQVTGVVSKPLQYIFEAFEKDWEPVYDERRSRTADKAPLKSLSTVHAEEFAGSDWRLVRSLRSTNREQSPKLRQALLQFTPEAGSYILFSTGIRKQEQK